MREIICDTGALQKLDNAKEAIKYFKDAGFKYFDYTLFTSDVVHNVVNCDDYALRTQELKKYCDELGMICRQSHSYFTVGIDQHAIDLRVKYIKRNIEITSIMGADIMVIHPIWEWTLEQNVDFINQFVPLAHKFNVRLAIENVWGVSSDGMHKIPMCSSSPEGLKKLIESINDPLVGACIDIGHAEMEVCNTTCEDMIKTIGNKIFTLHIHDNDKSADLHQIPYSYLIDFEKMLDALKEVGYKGNIVFEVERVFGSLPKELYVPTLEYLYKIGEYFIKRLDD